VEIFKEMNKTKLGADLNVSVFKAGVEKDVGHWKNSDVVTLSRHKGLFVGVSFGKLIR
tara:strand:+ start:353 stop:526 length:174 start_codon:yes stop_codon:yes gene_type:complete